MTTPRWTVTDSDELWFGEGDFDPDTWLLFDDAGTWVDEGPYEALVECVRDADTLTRARQLVAAVKAGERGPDGWFPELLDLLTGDDR